MAVVVPIISEWNPKGVDRAMADIKKAEGKMGKMKAGLEKAFLPATAALGGLAAGAWTAAKAGEELASSQAALGQVLGQMGVGAATERLTGLADELERVMGIDEKQILAVQTSLGTFGEVAASADEAGGAFDRATLAALDLAAAGFGSAEGNAIQLGKALNDPVKGLAALTKSGVTFTDAEKDKIKTLVESGKTLEAQEMILAAIEGQVGGTAEATADSSAKMSLAFADVKESIGVALLPMFDAMNEKLAKVAGWAQENTGVILVLGSVIGVLAGGIVAANIAMKAWAAGAAIVKAASAAWTGVQWLLNAALSANPIGLVVLAIAALIAIIVLAWNRSDKFREIVTGAFEKVKDVIAAVAEWLREKFWPIVERVFEVVGGIVETYIGIWKTVFEAAWGVIKTVFGWLRDTFEPAISLVFATVGGVVEALGEVFARIFEGIKTAVSAAWDFIRPIIEKIQAGIDGIKGAWDAVSGIGGAIGGIFGRSAPTPSTLSRSGGGVQVNVTAGVGDPVAIARTIERTLRTAQVRTGIA